MLPSGFPRWAVWLMNAVVLAIVWIVAYFAKLAGWQICLGFIIGFFVCYLLYGCWRVDDMDEDYSRFPPEEREARRQRDRAIDPRVR